MKQKQTYKPVGCDFVDQIEIFATQRQEVDIKYFDNKGIEQSVTATLKTWETVNKEEFLITQDGLRLRLDKVLSIGDAINNAACNF